MLVPPTTKTRKPVVKLRAADFRAFPVWEFAIDEEGRGKQDETWVRPVDCTAIRKGAHSQIVAANFVTRAGRSLQGFMVVTTAADPVKINPGAIVGAMGYRALPDISRKMATRRKLDWSIRERDTLLEALRESEEDVFPLKFALSVSIRGEPQVRHGIVK
jgi:hypothetical protein